ncbi:hypothetical protein [Stenotrophomonas rhizophila]|jgi:hypothetical protein|uniref:hypothetical protein n=1 Tax=Stenotrophomonas rhizophila TaxID=216778 RepID=UPI00081D22A3|nr:hypothetical protein [Stenotrophomonas rhizophila]AOA72443.1 hypothetical protein BAY15_2009 [Stenotrophomonas rhizophila]
MTDAKNKAWKRAGDDLLRMIQEALALLGKTASTNEGADRIRRLDLEWPAEDEFFVLRTWLGRCEVVHALDQRQVPSSSRRNAF